MRRIWTSCCAPAASGHAAAPPTKPMNSRRRIRFPLKLLCGAAYRGQGRMGTGCPSTSFAAREAGYGPSIHLPQRSIIPAFGVIADIEGNGTSLSARR
jgi:hypothetical protein